MSLLDEYEKRTAWKYGRLPDSLGTHPDLIRKINPDGSYAPFRGTTVYFRPGKACLGTVLLMQRILCRHLDGTLASPLPDVSFHMTLHDLISPEKTSADPAD